MIPLHQQSQPLVSNLLEPSSSLEISGIYWHIPFCFHKCHYCDFYSIAGAEDRQDQYVDRWGREFKEICKTYAPQPRTIFVGGGTPTLMTVAQWEQMLKVVHEHLDTSKLIEWTVEANPETLTLELLSLLISKGVTRISMGSQSFNPKHLKTLERWHDPANVIKAAQLIHEAGFDQWNLDHIYAIPGQTLEEYHQDLQQAISLKPTHLSCYALTYEPNTALTKKMHLGRITPAEESVETQMFLDTIDILEDAGYAHYEVSNFAQADAQCEHNLIYWKNENWLALGPSASGHVNGLRWKNIPHLGQYLKGENALPPIIDAERLDAQDANGEALMMRLRLMEGLPKHWLPSVLTARRQKRIEQAIEDGQLYWEGEFLRLTRQGLLLTDYLAGELLEA